MGWRQEAAALPINTHTQTMWQLWAFAHRQDVVMEGGGGIIIFISLKTQVVFP